MQPPNLQQAVSRDGEPMRGHKAGPMGFAEVIAPAPASMPPIIASSTASVILLRLGGQRELVLPMAMDVEQIARLVAAIERSA